MEENKKEIQNNKKLIKVIIIIAVIFSFLSVSAIVAIGYLIYSMNMTKDEVQKIYIEDVYKEGDDARDAVDKVIKTDTVISDDSNLLDASQGGATNANPTHVREIKGEKIAKTYVDWFDELQPASGDDIKCEEYSKCFVAGTITQGKQTFIGKNMYLQVEEGMGVSFTHFVLFQKNGNKYKFIFDKENSPIAGIDNVPAELSISELGAVFTEAWPTSFFKDVSDVSNHELIRHDILGKVYRAQDDCLVAELPNHVAKAYGYKIPFVSDDVRVPKITFDDGTKNKDPYSYKMHTCISLCERYIHNDKVSENDLKIVGKAGNGDNIYVLKDAQNPILKELYADKNTVAYFGDDWSDKLDHNKYSYDEYISMRPFLYWRDPFGNFVQFTNEKFTVAAEMCKPVVYFYTNEQKNLHFDVNPVGGFTHTQPKYDNGWDLRTIGDGGIMDIKTGKEYDSLLWEGMALGYDVPDSGWVIAKEDLSNFFDSKLSELGLNNKEIIDFKEYWLDRLSDFPYYRVSFMDRGQFDELAPLSLSEKPDNIIRVMMIAKGEQDYYELPEQAITSNINRGDFTVVEWGGMLVQ